MSIKCRENAEDAGNPSNWRNERNTCSRGVTIRVFAFCWYLFHRQFQLCNSCLPTSKEELLFMLDVTFIQDVSFLLEPGSFARCSSISARLGCNGVYLISFDKPAKSLMDKKLLFWFLFFLFQIFSPHLITDENETKPTWKAGKPPRCDFGVTPLACSVWIMWIHAPYNVDNKGTSVSARATHERAAAGRRHAVPKEMLYKKSLRERCANGSCPGARRGLWLEGLEAAEGYFRKRYRK